MDRSNSLVIVSMVTGLLSINGPVAAQEIVKSGAIACGGAYTTRLNGNESHNTVYVLKNYNSSSTITVDNIQGWDHNGNAYSLGGPNTIPLPPQFRDVLLPHQSSTFIAHNLFPMQSPLDALQVRIDYTLDKPGMPLQANFVHIVNQSPNDNQVARQLGVCTAIPAGID